MNAADLLERVAADETLDITRVHIHMRILKTADPHLSGRRSLEAVAWEASDALCEQVGYDLDSDREMDFNAMFADIDAARAAMRAAAARLRGQN